MKQLRSSIFETNSSSTHSFSIKPKDNSVVKKDIPRSEVNTSIVFIVPEYISSNGGEEDTIVNTIITEVSKLSVIPNIIAGIMENDLDLSEKLCGMKVGNVDPELIKKCLTEDLILIKWLKEVVLEETGTVIKFPKPECSDYFPYYSAIWSETDPGGLFNELENSIRNCDEIRFKSLCREIIFNQEIIIVDKDEAYGCNFKENIL